MTFSVHHLLILHIHEAAVKESELLITTKIDEPVKLRSVPGSEESNWPPITVHELLARTVRKVPNLPAFGRQFWIILFSIVLKSSWAKLNRIWFPYADIEENACLSLMLVIAVCTRDGNTRSWTFLEYYKEVVRVAKSLIALGLQQTRAVCMLGFNAPEWVFGNIGAIFAGY